MKKRILKISTILVLFVALAAVFAEAQSNRPTKISVPFDFIVDNENLPSGEYTIRRSSRSRPGALTIRSRDGDIARAFITQRAVSRRPQAVKVTFHKYGTKHFLSQVWPAGSMNGRNLIKCQSEIEMATSAAESQDAPQLQEIVLTDQ